MSHRIFKYPLEVESRQILTMPIGARVLSIDEQNECPVLFALVDSEAEFEQRIFRVVSTGEDFNAEDSVFVGAVILKGWYSAFVFEQPATGAAADPVSDRYAEDMAQLRDEIKSS